MSSLPLLVLSHLRSLGKSSNIIECRNERASTYDMIDSPKMRVSSCTLKYSDLTLVLSHVTSLEKSSKIMGCIYERASRDYIFSSPQMLRLNLNIEGQWDTIFSVASTSLLICVLLPLSFSCTKCLLSIKALCSFDNCPFRSFKTKSLIFCII